jgi:hypothetical protein
MLRLELHDIRDADAFVGRVIVRSHLELDYHRRERLHQFLLIALWRLSQTYDANGRPSNFSGIAGAILPKRIIDWQRSPEEGGRTIWTKPRSGSGKQYADSYERQRPQLVSIDDDPEHGDVGATLSGGSLDDGEHRLADELRSLRKRARRPSRREPWVGESAA